MFEEAISFKVDNLRLKGKLFLPGSRGLFPFVCLCHGIPAKPYDPKEKGYEEIAEKFCHEGFAAFIFNFRGCGESEGDFDILGWTRDLKTALDLMHNHSGIDENFFTVLGSSAGAAVALYHTAQNKRVTHLITLACPAGFSFIADPIRTGAFLDGCRQVGIFRSSGFPVNKAEWLNGFEEVKPAKYISAVSPRPFLLVHGEADELIPPSDAVKLFEQAQEPKELKMVPGAGHRLRNEPGVIASCLEWLRKKIAEGNKAL